MTRILCPVTAALLALATEVRADIIFSTFNPANGSGYSGTGANLIGPGPYNTYLGMQFTPTITEAVSGYDLALNNGGGSAPLTFQLLSDSKNTPNFSTVLDSFSLTVTSSLNEIYSAPSTSSPMLTAGTEYWLVGTTASGSIYDWLHNSAGDTGLLFKDTSSNPANGTVSSNTLAAFRVDGNAATVPEPSSLVLLTLAVLAGGGLHLQRRNPKKASES